MDWTDVSRLADAERPVHAATLAIHPNRLLAHFRLALHPLVKIVNSFLVTTAFFLLDRWALYRAKRTKHAAIA